MSLRPWLRLARITNLPTIVADVSGGCLIASGYLWLGLFDPVRSAASESLTGKAARDALGGWVPAWLALVMMVAAACSLYLSGMIDNDVQHVGKDRMLSKSRPIVDDAVKLNHAAFVRQILALLGILFAGLSAAAVHPDMRWIATAGLGLSLAIVFGSRLYNRLNAGRIVEFTWHPPTRGESTAGLFLLAVCRMCSMALGVVVGAAAATHIDKTTIVEHVFAVDVIAALATSGLWFFLVTRLSLMEDFGGKPEAVKRMGSLLTLVMWSGPIVIYVHHYDGFSDARYLAECLPALLCLLTVSIPVWVRLAAAGKTPTPANIGKIIGTCIAFWPMVVAAMVMLSGTLDANDATGGSRLAAGLAIAAMTPLCLILRRLGSGT